jgi:hypothetical protein
MTLPISPEERTLLESLDRIVYSPDLQLKLQPIVSRVRAQLAVEKQAVMTWEPIAMSTFGAR